MTPEDVQAYFTGSDGTFRFARWSRPIAPVVFGVDDTTLPVIKGGIEAVARLASLDVVETDPDMGANMMMFFVSSWSELGGVNELTELVPELTAVVPKLRDQKANQYRLFRFEADGSIRAVFVFVKLDQGMADMDARSLAIQQAVQMVLLWGHGAFSTVSPLGRLTGSQGEVLRPDIAALIRAAYDPVLPAGAEDASFALRLYARYSQILAEQGG